jgi:proteolipid membrane potential modulator/LITAF-like zinc ribbon protein
MPAIGFSEILVLIVVAVVIYRALTRPRPSSGMICPACGTRTEPTTRTPGSIWIEIVLWLCFIIPGLIYSLWRLTSKEKVCPACGATGMIPVSTPRGQQLVDQVRPRVA